MTLEVLVVSKNKDAKRTPRRLLDSLAFRACLDFSDGEAIREYVARRQLTLETGKKSPQAVIYAELLRAGLRSLEGKERTQSFSAHVQLLRKLLQPASEIDLSPHPCPSNVDPVWWAEKEKERIESEQVNLIDAIKDALEILISLEATIKGAPK